MSILSIMFSPPYSFRPFSFLPNLFCFVDVRSPFYLAGKSRASSGSML